MTTATVTRRLHAEGHPIELVRGNGYHYFVWDDGAHYECHSLYVYRFRDLTVDQWVQEGRDFAARTTKDIAEREERCGSFAKNSVFKMAFRPTR